ncbi:MAG TPA: hypothetical protein VLE96_06365 [Chlamydiales bacterium]|nr:hypothetical protein [Chlamydiales bacterium]
MFFRKKTEIHVPAYSGKIEVFSRHCVFSSISHKKKRITGFSKERCYQNLMKTIDLKDANITHFVDTAGGDAPFLLPEKTIKMSEGTEAGSFLRMLEYVTSLSLHPETIVYFVEDDYIHRPGWVGVMKEAFQIPNIDYVTLYDHHDKYFFPIYAKLTSRLFATQSCHWRTTPSTTQTFAMRFKTLLRDQSIHCKYSKNRKISADHEKFLHLGKKGSILISSIPGWSTHAEPEFSSPTIEWEQLIIQQSGVT